MTAIDFEAINRAASANGRWLVQRLIPGGKFRSFEYLPLNPRRNDHTPGSFSINYKTGQWGDFATDDRGGDFVSLFAYLKGVDQGDAARELAGMLNFPLPRSNGANGSGGNVKATSVERHSPPPSAPKAPNAPTFPGRTPPDGNGKPAFTAGDAGPIVGSEEMRRHVYRRDGVPVRIKIKFCNGRFANWYRVTDTAAAVGWQAAKPADYIDVPYVTHGINPFDSEVIEDALFWPEGEKDVDSLTRLGMLALTFGGTGDGLPPAAADHIANRDVVILADNDDPGRKHAQAKAAVAFRVAKSVKIVEFPELPEGGDVSDWIAQGPTADELNELSDGAPLWTPPILDADKPPAKHQRKLISQRASAIKPQRVEHLWPGRIAIGKLTLIAGKPGVGKSNLTCYGTAIVTKGGAWPCDEGRAPIGNVVILSAEDGLADTIVPRLMAAGADLDRVEVVSGTQDERGRKTFDIKADIDLLEQKVKEIGDVKLIVIDPISAYMGKIDGHGNVETRSVLEPLAETADRLRIAVAAVTHLNKGGTGTQGVLERFIGSIAFVAAARAAFIVIDDDENEGRVLFLEVKNNLAKKQKGLAFRRMQTIIEGDIVASYIDWESNYVTQSADEALSATEQRAADGATVKDQAIEFLKVVLADGPMPVKEIEREAIEACLLGEGKSIGDCKPFRAAKKELQVETVKSSMGEGWVWSLPKAPSPPEGALPNMRAPSDTKGAFGQENGASLPGLEIPARL
jgi:putative DNA primase/helicase